MADLGGVYEQAGQWDRAEAVYRRALAIDAEDGDIRVRLGSVLLRRGDAAGARREADGRAGRAAGPDAPALDLIGRRPTRRERRTSERRRVPLSLIALARVAQHGILLR